MSSFSSAAVVEQVRLAYMARELPPGEDGHVFHFRPDVEVLHAMQRPTAPGESCTDSKFKSCSDMGSPAACRSAVSPVLLAVV